MLERANARDQSARSPRRATASARRTTARSTPRTSRCCTSSPTCTTTTIAQRDTPDKINAAGEARVVDLAERVVRDIADRPARLTYVRVAAPVQASSREGTDVYLGSIPDMAGGDTPGLKLTGVRAGSPADVGGIKAGDVIVEFGGKPVKDLYQYSDALYAHKPGDEVTVVVLRDGQRVSLKVKLGKRGG